VGEDRSGQGPKWTRTEMGEDRNGRGPKWALHLA